MKKLLLIALLICFVCFVFNMSLKAQDEPTVQKGAQMLSYKLGYGWSWGGNRIGFIPGIFSYDAGVSKLGPGTLTLGGMFMFSIRSYYMNLYFAFKGAWHYNFRVPKFDAFVGLTAGPKIPIYKFSDQRVIDWIGVNSYFGASYYFTDHFGLTTEVGLGTVNWYLFGMSFKIK